jgi:hypothetical protein
MHVAGMQLLLIARAVAVTEYYTAVSPEHDLGACSLYGVDGTSEAGEGFGWYHMLPPDRMHLFNQGMWRHFLKWLCDLVLAWRPLCRQHGMPEMAKQQKQNVRGKQTAASDSDGGDEQQAAPTKANGKSKAQKQKKNKKKLKSGSGKNRSSCYAHSKCSYVCRRQQAQAI